MENELDPQPLQASTEPAGAESLGAEQQPAFDPNSLVSELGFLGEGLRPENIGARVKKLHMSNSELGQKNREYEAIANQFAPLREEMKDPQFNQFMQQSLQQYYEQRAQQNPYGTPQAIMQSFDPLAQRQQQQEIELRSLKIERDLDRLEASGFNIKDEQRREALAEKMINNPTLNARDSYMILFGEEDMRARERQAVTATAQTIQKNNNAYRQVGQRTVAPQPSKFDPRTATQAEMVARTAEIMASMRGQE